MILCYTHRPESSIIVVREAHPSTKETDAELRESCGRGGRRIVETRGNKDTTRKLIESINLGP